MSSFRPENRVLARIEGDDIADCVGWARVEGLPQPLNLSKPLLEWFPTREPI
jgi:hypothetical protein